MSVEPTMYVGNIKLNNYGPDSLSLMAQGQVVFEITSDGMVHLGPGYKENPDAAAQEFIRIIMDMMPKAFAARKDATT
jgi:hypothetical protein